MKILDLVKNLTIRKFWLLKLWNDQKNSYFQETGWLDSFRAKQVLDKDGNKIPWLSYGAFKILDEKIIETLKVFEFGVGASTEFFSRKNCKITSIEHNKDWYEMMAAKKLQDVTINFCSSVEDYVGFMDSSTDKFDIILNDGINRVDVFKKSMNALSERGILILDDSEREEYNAAFEFAKEANFRVLNLWGLANGMIDLKCTTIFYKSNNCLGI